MQYSIVVKDFDTTVGTFTVVSSCRAEALKQVAKDQAQVMEDCTMLCLEVYEMRMVEL